MQESLVFLILGVGRLREDQFIYVETRENVFFYDTGPLKRQELKQRVSDRGGIHFGSSGQYEKTDIFLALKHLNLF